MKLQPKSVAPNHDQGSLCPLILEFPADYNASAILFDNLAAGRGARIALRSDLGDRTYDALCAETGQFGNALLSLGLIPGDRVLLFLDDTPVYAAAFFGALRAGLVPMLINTLSRADSVRFFLEDSDARVAVVDAAFAGLFSPEVLAGTACETMIVTNGNAPPGQRDAGWVSSFSPALVPVPVGPEAMAFWMYSSGSTGRPKGVVHRHCDMAYTVEGYARPVLTMTEDDCCFSIPKIFFAYGFGNSLTFPFSVGASALLLSGRPTPPRIYDQIARHRPTILFGLPTLYTAMIKDESSASAELVSVRLCISAAEILSEDVFASWRDRFGHRIVEGLGSTEVLHIYLTNSEDRQKPGSAGQCAPGYEVKLTDTDGVTVPEGAEGIMWVRGGSNALTYWNRPDKTAETMRDGWIYTGDRFTRDEDGFYFFRGRADDLVKVSGQWVYPLEIELALAEHPLVRECAVLAIEMADRRTTLKAWVVAEPGATPGPELTKQLQDYLKRELLPYKYPRSIDYPDSLPKTGTDKIDRQALRSRG
ncbi:MAG: benzoate-CoA ligase family protein [Rhodospirillales bacterium]